MIFSIEWLNEYCKIDSDAQTLSDRLTMQAAEVEEIVPPPLPLQEAKLAKIINIKKHPNADRLKLVDVKIGQITKTVVCGANNIEVGCLAPYLAEGNHYYDNEKLLQTIEPVEIRGIKSAGMLASARDLGISAEHNGVLVIKSDEKVQNLQKYLGFTKPLLKLEITPNRADLFSYFGLARELSFIENSRLKEVAVQSLFSTNNNSNPLLDIKIETDKCARYAAVVLTNITNVQSPRWLANRLLLSGINPINAVVDVTNYVMLELGQPLHAFDYDKLNTQKERVQIVVRQAKKEEKIESLDGTSVQLTKNDTVISNDNRAVALAGIVGSNNSAIDQNTKMIVLEAALFHAGSIRKSSLNHNLRTESSTRFEKGIDPELPVIALKRATSLLKDICQSEAVGRLHDISSQKFDKKRLNISLLKAEQKLGMKLDRTKIKHLLSAIGFSVSSISKEGLSVLVPSWRLDINIEEDLHEEIARLMGYENIPQTQIGGSFIIPQKKDLYWKERNIRQYLLRRNIFEAVSQPFFSEEDTKLYQLKNLVELANPTSANEQYLRSNISVPLIKKVMAESRKVEEVSYFEIGKTFLKDKSSLKEESSLGVVILAKEYLQTTRLIKSLILGVYQTLSVKDQLTFKFAKSDKTYLADNIEEIYLNTKRIGYIGVVKNEIIKKRKVRGTKYIVLGELQIDHLLKARRVNHKIENPSAYPAVIRDLSIVIKKGTVQDALHFLATIQLNHLSRHFVTDVFEDEEGIYTVTIRYVFQSYTTTLKDELVNQQIKRVVQLINSSKEITIKE